METTKVRKNKDSAKVIKIIYHLGLRPR